MTDTDSIRFLAAEVDRFARERDWGQFHNAKNLVMLLTSEAGELAAEYRWVHTTDADALLDAADKRVAVANEIADVAIALLALCNRTKIDLAEAVLDKLAKNAVAYPIDKSMGRAERAE